jgi:hypothetical protein
MQGGDLSTGGQWEQGSVPSARVLLLSESLEEEECQHPERPRKPDYYGLNAAAGICNTTPHAQQSDAAP